MKGSQAMARKRTVLGNDPFQRGAAVRPEAQAKAEDAKRRSAAEQPEAKPRAEVAKRRSAAEHPETKARAEGTKRRRASAQPESKPKAEDAKRRSAAVQPEAKPKAGARRRRAEAEPKAEDAKGASKKPTRKQRAAKESTPRKQAAKRPAETEAAPEILKAPGDEALLPPDAGAEARRPSVVAVETIAPAPTHAIPLRTHPTAIDALEAAATAVAGMLRLPGSPTATSVDEFGRDAGFEEQVRPLLEWIYERWFRVDAHGFESLPRDVPLVLVANRAGALPWDSLILSLAARRAGLEVRPLVEDSIFHFPSMGLLVNRLGAVRACPENAERILGAGGAVAVFPEGATGFGKPYRERYRLQRFGRGGFLRLALRMEALVVPVSIVGSEEIYPLLGKVGVKPFGFPFLPITPTFPWLGLAGLLPLPARWHIDVGEPFDFRGYGKQAAQDEPLVMRLAEEVRGTVQNLLDARLGQRRSVFR